MAGNDTSNSYRSILKGTSIFGGVQIFNILINLVRGKFVALILGPEGMGVSSLFNSSLNTIQRLSALGLNFAIVKEVAQDSDEPCKLSNTLAIAKRLITISAIVGALICMAFCVPLSRLTFGNTEWAPQFVMLGLAVGFGVASTGTLSILQGLHEIKSISKASIVGGLTGLLIGVPLYYFFGDKGIVPAFVTISLSLFIFYIISLHKCKGLPQLNRFSWREHLPAAKKLLLLGIVLMTNELMVNLVTYLLNLYIRVQGSIDDIGLYQAANSITNQYSGLVFTAMAMDYFPRLSKSAGNNVEMAGIVNRQTEIVAFIIAPAMTLLILSAPLLIRLLLTDNFMPVLPLMRWMGLGILLRALAFPMGYISFAKGNKKLFFWLEGIGCNVLTLFLSCLFFGKFGLMGLGYALVADNALCIVIYYIINSKLYGYGFSRGSFSAATVAIILGISCCAVSLIAHPVFSYTAMSAVVAASIFWGILNLKRKLSSD